MTATDKTTTSILTPVVAVQAKPAAAVAVAPVATKPEVSKVPLSKAVTRKTAAAKPVTTKATKQVTKQTAAIPAPRSVTKPVVKKATKVPVKVKKIKMVRDSFTMPKPEYEVMDELKLRAAKMATPVKKTELLRAGVKALAAMSDVAFKAAIQAVPSLKTGRPAKTKAA